MLEDSVNMLTQLIADSAKDRKDIADALNNVANSLAGLKVQAPDMNPSEMFEKMVQDMANLGVSQNLGQTGQEGHHSPRPKTATEKVKEYLAMYPSARYEPVRDLAEKIGVGKSTVSRVINENL